jgi:hypothetical protein
LGKSDKSALFAACLRNPPNVVLWLRHFDKTVFLGLSEFSVNQKSQFWAECVRNPPNVVLWLRHCDKTALREFVVWRRVAEVRRLSPPPLPPPPSASSRLPLSRVALYHGGLYLWATPCAWHARPRAYGALCAAPYATVARARVAMAELVRGPPFVFSAGGLFLSHFRPLHLYSAHAPAARAHATQRGSGLMSTVHTPAPDPRAPEAKLGPR